jgi:hypothetical protein
MRVPIVHCPECRAVMRINDVKCDDLTGGTRVLIYRCERCQLNLRREMVPLQTEQ